MDFVRVKPKGNISGALIKRMLGALKTGLI